MQGLKTYPYAQRIACAGDGFVVEDILMETVDLPYREGADFCIGVNGDSMEPDYSDGDIVYVQRTNSLRPGEVGIFFAEGECFIKELGRKGLLARNPAYPPLEDLEDVVCAGRVLGKAERPD